MSIARFFSFSLFIKWSNLLSRASLKPVGSCCQLIFRGLGGPGAVSENGGLPEKFCIDTVPDVLYFLPCFAACPDGQKEVI